MSELSLWACCSEVGGDVLGGGRLVVGQNFRRRFVRYVTSDVNCWLVFFCTVFAGVSGFGFKKKSFFARELVDLMFCSTHYLYSYVYLLSFLKYVSR